MKDRHDSGLTVVGGRPNDEGQEASGMSPGFQTLLERLARNPKLARDLVADPEATLASEGLALAPAELAMLQHLEPEDLEQARSMPRRAMRSRAAGRSPSYAQEAARSRPAARSRAADQLETVAPFVDDHDFYMRERTRGIRPQSLYPTPFAVAEALLRTNEEFRDAFLADPQNTILTWPGLPLGESERRVLLAESVQRRLERVARNA